jgi:hypothetical protein
MWAQAEVGRPFLHDERRLLFPSRRTGGAVARCSDQGGKVPRGEFSAPFRLCASGSALAFDRQLR